MKKKNNIPFRERNQQFNWREKQNERAMKIHEQKEWDAFRSLKEQLGISDKDREFEEACKRLRECLERNDEVNVNESTISSDPN